MIQLLLKGFYGEKMMIINRKSKWFLISVLSLGLFLVSYIFYESSSVGPIENLIACFVAGWFLVICYFVSYFFWWVLFRTSWRAWDSKGATPLLWVTSFLFVSNGVNVYALH